MAALRGGEGNGVEVEVGGEVVVVVRFVMDR